MELRRRSGERQWLHCDLLSKTKSVENLIEQHGESAPARAANSNTQDSAHMAVAYSFRGQRLT